MSKFYVTTAIDYIDDVLHIGHAYQKVAADVLARYHRALGDEVFFLTGVDEHGGKAEKSAREHNVSFEQWADKISRQDQEQLASINISFDRYIRTTDKDHIQTVVDFWKKIDNQGDIYLDKYTGIYCPGCERFITEKDLVEGACPYHPELDLQELTEENYFFRLSKYEDFLKSYIDKNPEFVQPGTRRKEIVAFLNQGLEDIPISRPSVEWGIPVPGDNAHTIYVWFDALINYFSGAPEGFWPADVHFLGKDNLFWHAVLWPAMLKSAGYVLPKIVYAHGFLSLEGRKISKSLGNVIRPSQLAEEFGSDAIRYYLCRSMSLPEDGNLSLDHLESVYNSNLAHGLGNLVSRVATLCDKAGVEIKPGQKSLQDVLTPDLAQAMGSFRYNLYLELVWQRISAANAYITKKKPWNYLGEKEQQSDLEDILSHLVSEIREIALLVRPFIPIAARKIEEQFQGPGIKAAEPIFPRI
ncbi:MAG: methionine--tRNA ligase [Patescibacteria group bacterium]|nr:methionine--tRNA ligase [Patescibacteria group bacterium]